MQKSRIELLKDFISDDPLDYFSRYALALEYVKEGKIKTGIEILEKILTEDENYIAAYYQLGKIYEMISDIDKAKLAYNKGIEKTRGKDNKTYNELRSALNLLLDEEE